VFGTVMENIAFTSLTYQISGCSTICTSLTTSILRMALPSPLQTMLGSRNAFRTGLSVQGCTNYHIALGGWGWGRKVQKGRDMLIVLRLLSPIVTQPI